MPAAARVSTRPAIPALIAGPGAPNVLINGLPAARVGDTHTCAFPPLAGPHPPNTDRHGQRHGADRRQAGGARWAISTGCGATIVAGSPNV